MTAPRGLSGRRIVLVLALLAVSAVGGFLAQRLTAIDRGPRLTALPQLARAAPPDNPAPSPRRAIPDTLPSISLPGPDGRIRQLQDFRGKALIVNFWATWCEPCRREIPLLESLRREHAGGGLEVVGVAIDQGDAVRQYAQSHGMDYPLLIGEDGGLAAASALGMDTVLPFTVFADREGRIVTVKVGELHRDEAEFILGRVRDVEAGALSLEAARTQVSDGVRHLNLARAGSGS